MAVCDPTCVGLGGNRDHQRSGPSPLVTSAGGIYTGRRHGAFTADPRAPSGRATAPRPASPRDAVVLSVMARPAPHRPVLAVEEDGDRKSTRLNSSHSQISYAVFCL